MPRTLQVNVKNLILQAIEVLNCLTFNRKFFKQDLVWHCMENDKDWCNIKHPPMLAFLTNRPVAEQGLGGTYQLNS